MKGDGDNATDKHHRTSTLSPSGRSSASRSPMQDLSNSRSNLHHRSQTAIHHTNGDCTTNGTHHTTQTKDLRDTQHRAISTELGDLTAPGETKTKTQMARAFQETQELYKSADSKAGLQTVKTHRVLKKTTTITRGENEKVRLWYITIITTRDYHYLFHAIDTYVSIDDIALLNSSCLNHLLPLSSLLMLDIQLFYSVSIYLFDNSTY